MRNLYFGIVIFFFCAITCAASPQVSAVNPDNGAAGTQVQINGSGFGATQGSSTVAFNNVNATIVSWSDTQIVAAVPSTAATGPVKVTVSGVASNTSVYFNVPPPQITSISPTSGVVGTQVTISGVGFGATQGSSYLRFNTATGSVVSWSDTQIVAAVGTGAMTGPVYVNAYAGSSNRNLVFTLPNPVVAGLQPSSGTVGTQVQINGSGFGSTQGSSTIAFNNVNATVVSWSDTQVVATVLPLRYLDP